MQTFLKNQNCVRSCPKVYTDSLKISTNYVKTCIEMRETYIFLANKIMQKLCAVHKTVGTDMYSISLLYQQCEDLFSAATNERTVFSAYEKFPKQTSNLPINYYVKNRFGFHNTVEGCPLTWIS